MYVSIIETNVLFTLLFLNYSFGMPHDKDGNCSNYIMRSVPLLPTADTADIYYKFSVCSAQSVQLYTKQ